MIKSQGGKPEWIRFGDEGERALFWRLKITGGWLIQTSFVDEGAGGLGLAFVPDPAHEHPPTPLVE
ncbi:MAG: hypothetical protein QNJ90_09145 [Planctomycetota bacterium]|nr:hypothetical protein [Planctomycetota bacterium]